MAESLAAKSCVRHPTFAQDMGGGFSQLTTPHPDRSQEASCRQADAYSLETNIEDIQWDLPNVMIIRKEIIVIDVGI